MRFSIGRKDIPYIIAYLFWLFGFISWFLDWGKNVAFLLIIVGFICGFIGWLLEHITFSK